MNEIQHKSKPNIARSSIQRIPPIKTNRKFIKYPNLEQFLVSKTFILEFNLDNA